jgi:tRNA modification GTPase
LSFHSTDTIVAIATPPGRGGLGVVRVSGPEAVRIGRALIDRDYPLEPRHATLARVPGVDQVVVTWFAAPYSFTGDEVIELSGHGSPVVLQGIVERALTHGARLAEPGEFTLRAYLNGRIDLVQAEAVADLVNAVTPLQARVAMDQLDGTLTGAIAAIDAALFDLVARLEASLDFPDEGFHFVTRDDTILELDGLAQQLSDLIRAGERGRVIREGRTVVIAGRPNAGKSSVFNALVGAARAIVTDVAGTTRDVLTEKVDIEGVPVTLMDTAGLREATDAIEAEGVRRARQAKDVAALTLAVVDASVGIGDEDRALMRSVSPTIVAINKVDLPRAWQPDELALECARVVEISAATGAGLDELRRMIVVALAGDEDWRDTPAMTNVRHVALARTAHDAITTAIRALQAGATEELAVAELQSSRTALEEITGRRAPDDLLNHIFGKFCIGK